VAQVATKATVTDASGNVIDLEALDGQLRLALAAVDETEIPQRSRQAFCALGEHSPLQE
jgi:hypothetical protein